MPLDLTIGGPVPTWAQARGAPGNRFESWMPSAAEFGAFVRAVATRYSGHYTPPGAPAALPRISFWSIWNEPNYGVDLSPQAIDQSRVEVSPRLYRGLVDAAWSAFAATGHRGDTILIGETAPRGITTGNSPGNFSGMVPLRFIRALYCVDTSFTAAERYGRQRTRLPAGRRRISALRRRSIPDCSRRAGSPTTRIRRGDSAKRPNPRRARLRRSGIDRKS